MIYTVGKTDVYEKARKENHDVEKLKGGSVWRTSREALGYLVRSGLIGTYSVYVISASWDIDTEESPNTPWRSLTRNARIIGRV